MTYGKKNNEETEAQKRQAAEAARSTLKIVLHGVTILIIQIGIYQWYHNADWNNEQWVTAYYVWDKFIFILFVLCCISPVKTMRPFWIVIGIFFVVRLLFEFWSIEHAVRWLYDYKVMFLINLLCTVLIIRNSLKCRKQS